MEPLPGLQSIAPPEENGRTFEENAVLKARYYSRYTSELVLADDSGLAVDALEGAPGILSARFAGPGASDTQNNDLLLSRLTGVKERAARFVCVIALAQRGATIETFRGEVAGELIKTTQGKGGFGYDPLFFYPPLNKTFAELTAEQKLTVSHRGRALRQLFIYLARRPNGG